MELFQNADATTVMCACARMRYHVLERFWVRGSVSVWTENTSSIFATGLVRTENILCFFQFIRNSVDGTIHYKQSLFLDWNIRARRTRVHARKSPAAWIRDCTSTHDGWRSRVLACSSRPPIPEQKESAGSL